ncbi:DUF2291 family protein [Arenibacter sp. GZD96]|uniref:DUF2291 family protein n=1 Tax=Aurantibrevibacter litoralis TaxID=3106030 RepID=UPI002AFF7850|nr:DUF2291 family protein [Arenibacter sp. GZD-96]MEA1787074.1 DUF2291 family protein [Arenibacter sp. GZD-96]
MAILIAFTLYHSIRITPLDQARQAKSDSVFNAKAYAIAFMSDKIEDLPAINASVFIDNISNDLMNYCFENGKKLGISDEYNFIIQGNANVKAIEDEYIMLALEDNKEVQLATDFIFGNAIRDGSGMAHIDDYQNTMDFNSISVELNNIVRETLVPILKEKVKIGDSIYFKGAVKIDIEKPNIKELKVIPVRIKFKN